MRSSRLSRFCSARTWWKTSASRRYDSTSGGTTPTCWPPRPAAGKTAALTALRALTNRISARQNAPQSRRCTRTRDAGREPGWFLLFSVPVIQGLEASDDADAPEGDLVRAGVVTDVVRLSRAVGEEGQAAVAGAECVRDTGSGGARDHVVRPDGVLLLAEQQRAAAVEDDEDLFLGRMAVRRRG